MEFSKPRKIFIVDDDPALSDALYNYLTRNVRHQVFTYYTGEECLKHIDDETDVVIIDYEMNSGQKADARGLELLHTIKKVYPRIHIIILSSQERYSVALETIHQGAEQYVIKDEDAFEKISAMINEL
ncbi:MAG: response regulator [Chitinophagaceae bacterium]|nr:response regulator [Chitinophagaceae bacterium]